MALGDDLSRAREDVEQLFYAVQLLIRGMRPLRVRNKELASQKLFLLDQLEQAETLRKEVIILYFLVISSRIIDDLLILQLHNAVFNMAPDHKVVHKPVTFKGEIYTLVITILMDIVAAIAILARNRLIKMSKQGGLAGQTVSVGREKIILATRQLTEATLVSYDYYILQRD